MFDLKVIGYRTQTIGRYAMSLADAKAAFAAVYERLGCPTPTITVLKDCSVSFSFRPDSHPALIELLYEMANVKHLYGETPADYILSPVCGEEGTYTKIGSYSD